MPVITDISKQKRNETRYSIYLDGTYAFSLSDLDLSTSSLRVGGQLSDQEVAEWQNQVEHDKTYQLAVGFLSYRPRSGREIMDYLRRKDIEPGPATQIVEQLTKQGLVNDQAFAEAWIRYRQSLRPRSRHQLQQELMQKGLAREVIDEALAALDNDEQQAALIELIEKKRRSSQYQEPSKLMAYLARQGFGYDQIKKALARLDD